MKKLFVLMIALMIIAVPSFAQVVVSLDAESASWDGWQMWDSKTGGGWGSGFTWDFSSYPDPVYAGDFSYWLHSSADCSFGAAYAFNAIPGAQYTVNGFWKGAGGPDWIEVLMFSDDNRTIYQQCDAPVPGAIIAKHDGWNLGPSTFDWEPITNAMYPGSSNTITATANRMYVVIKAGNGGGGVNAWFDNITVTQVVPEPSSLFALASGIGALGFGLRRKIR